MPAGDQVTTDFHVELRGLLHGTGTSIRHDRRRGGVSGLLDRPGKAAESEYAHAPGSFMGEVHPAARSATFNFQISGVTASTAGTTLESCLTAWDPSGSAPEALWFQWPGFGKRYVLGYPLGLMDVDTTLLVAGIVPFAALFRITDPTIYT